MAQVVNLAPLNAFIDESGNTGRNYLDRHQPFYVLGGWAVSPECAESCRKVLENWERRVAEVSSGRELKASSVLKQVDGEKKVLRLMAALLDAGAIPTCCVFEKRFGICVNLHSAFFSEWILRQKKKMTLPDAEQNNAAAIFFYDHLSDGVLELFAEAVYEKNLDKLDYVRKQLMEELLHLGAIELVIPLDMISTKDFAKFPFWGSGAVNTINYTVFHTQVMLLEGLSRLRVARKWNLFHDDVGWLGKAFRSVIDSIAEFPGKNTRLSNGLQLFAGRLRLGQLQFISSKEDALIRCADHYVGFLNHTFKRMSQEKSFKANGSGTALALLDSRRLGLPPLNFYTLGRYLQHKVDELLRVPAQVWKDGKHCSA